MDLSNNELNIGPVASPETGEDEFWGQVLEKVTTEQLAPGTDSESEALATSAVAEIDKLMSELVSARDYLMAEADRIKRETARLKNLSKTAVASVHIISDNLSKWRENGRQAA
jgi:predicted PilT family ATPase